MKKEILLASIQNAELLKQIAIYKEALVYIKEKFGEVPDKLRLSMKLNARNKSKEPRILLLYRLEFSDKKNASEIFDAFHLKVHELFWNVDFSN